MILKRVHLYGYRHTDTDMDTFSLCPYDMATRPDRNSSIGTVLKSAPDGSPCPYPHKWTHAQCFQHVLFQTVSVSISAPHKWTHIITSKTKSNTLTSTI